MRVVTAIRRDTSQAVVESAAGEFAAEQVVNCAGLYSDRVARLSGVKPSALILPFRGEFYTLKPEAYHLVRGLIYPLAIRTFRSSASISPRSSTAASNAGRMRCWPSPAKVIATPTSICATWPNGPLHRFVADGGQALADGLRGDVAELQQAGVRAGAAAADPGDQRDEQLDWAPAGVRAQAVSREGNIIDDWIIDETDRVVNVENAPSPAATAALNIGRLVVDRLAPRFA